MSCFRFGSCKVDRHDRGAENRSGQPTDAPGVGRREIAETKVIVESRTATNGWSPPAAALHQGIRPVRELSNSVWIVEVPDDFDAADGRCGSWLCKNHSTGRLRARLIQTARRSRMKDSSRQQACFFCCALTTVSRVFTQPGSHAASLTSTNDAAWSQEPAASRICTYVLFFKRLRS